VEIDGVLQSMGADKRVVFPQTYAPVDRTLAEAIVKLGTALAKGDATGMEGLLAPEARPALAMLKASGEWEASTGKIEGLRVVMVTETPGVERATSSEVLLQTAVYCGVPAAIDAFRSAREVLTELGKLPQAKG